MEVKNERSNGFGFFLYKSKYYYRHVNLNDFEYSYKVFTPLENLTENGVVIKHIFRNRFDLDSELSLKFAAFNVSFSLG